MTVIALHFGASGRELFGLYHAAGEGAGRAPAVLLCNAFGHEEIRAHRIFRVLAERLAIGGSPVLRFDYGASGDSAGDESEARLEHWQADILAAHQELRDMSGANRVVWIGLRLGAALATRAAAAQPVGLAGLVLWDPVIDGRAYLAELAEAHAAHLYDDPKLLAGSAPRGPGAPLGEALGIAIAAVLEADMRALDLTALDHKPARKVLVLGKPLKGAAAKLDAQLRTLGCTLDWNIEDDASGWNSEAAMNAFTVPVATLNAITAAIGGWR